MKTAEELNTLKEELETLNRKLTELTEEELTQVTGGTPEAYQEAGNKIRDLFKLFCTKKLPKEGFVQVARAIVLSNPDLDNREKSVLDSVIITLSKAFPY